VNEFQQTIPAAEAETILATVLMTQYMDTIKEAASKGHNTFLLPSSPGQVAAMEAQLHQALLTSEKHAHRKYEDE